MQHPRRADPVEHRFACFRNPVILDVREAFPPQRRQRASFSEPQFAPGWQTSRDRRGGCKTERHFVLWMLSIKFCGDAITSNVDVAPKCSGNVASPTIQR